MTRLMTFFAALFFFMTAEATPLKVGVIVPLSGPLATYGQVTRQGIELAVKEHPSEFSTLQFLYEDSQYDGKTSVTAFRKLVEQDKVDVVYVWGTAPSEVIAPLAKSMKKPTIVHTTDENIHLNNPWILRSQSTPSQFGSRLAAHLDKNKLKRLAIFKVELAYYSTMFDGLRDSMAEDQSIVSVETFAPDQLDFKSSISKLKESGVDAIGVYLIPGQIAQLYKQLSQQKIQLPTFGTEDMGMNSEIAKAPNLMEGAVFAMNQVSSAFRDPYLNIFTDDTNISHAAEAFDVINILASIAKDTPSEEIMNKFRTISIGSGALGVPERINAENGGISLTFPVIIGIIKQGAVEPLPMIDRQ